MAITRTIERTVSLDAMAWRESLPGLAYQGEQNAHQFIIHCTQDGSVVTLTGSVLLKFLRPDGIAVDVPGSVVDGAAVVTLSGNCYEVMGRAEITIFVTQDSATVAVYSANTAVTRTTSGEEISGGDIINLPALQERFEEMAEAIEDAEEATANANDAVEYVAQTETSPAASAHAVGEYLIYNGTLYTVTAAIASGDTLTVGTNIAAVADGLGGEVTDLKNAVDNLIQNPLDIRKYECKKDTYINSSGEDTALSGYDTYSIPCSVGSFVRISWSALSGDPWAELSDTYAVKLFDGSGNFSIINSGINSKSYGMFSRTNKELIAIPSTNNSYVTFTVARDNASKVVVECGFPYEMLKANNMVDVSKTVRVITADTAVITQFYCVYSTGNVSVLGSIAKNAIMPVKSGDKVHFTTLRTGLTSRGFFRANDGTVTRLGTDAGATFDYTVPSDGILGTSYLAEETGDTILIPKDQVNISEENVYGLATTINELQDDIEGQIDDIEQNFDSTPVVYSTGQESGYYSVNSGGTGIEEKSSSSFSRSKIEVASWMYKISYTINSNTGISGSAVYCAFTDSSDALILNDGHEVGNHDTPIPANAKYIYLSFYGSTYVSGYTISVNSIARIKDIDDLGVNNPYDGLNGVAFGTSLTYRAQTTGGYLQYLPDLSGITFDNQGVGSSVILGDGGNLDMLAKIKAYTGFSGKRVCLVEGFVNDWYGQKTLGTYTDTAETTVCGCVRSALNYIMSQNANLTVFLILDPYGRNYNSVDCSSTAQRNSKTQYEYYEEIAKVARSLGIPVIKEYAGSQISENTPQYFLDNIHPNALGAKQSANFIWSQMRKYMPNVVS